MTRRWSGSSRAALDPGQAGATPDSSAQVAPGTCPNEIPALPVGLRVNPCLVLRRLLYTCREQQHRLHALSLCWCPSFVFFSPIHPRSLPLCLALKPLAGSVFGRRRLPPANLDPCAGRGHPYARRVTSRPPSLPHSRRDAELTPSSTMLPTSSCSPRGLAAGSAAAPLQQ